MFTRNRTNIVLSRAVVTALTFSLTALPASAAIINVDVQGSGTNGSIATADYTGASANGPIASSGTTWNYFNAGADPPSTSLSPLVDHNGAPTTVGVAFGAGWTGSFSDQAPNNLQGDRAYISSGTGTFTISGLDSSKTYNLAMITGVNAAGLFATDFTIGATTLTATDTSGAVGAANGPLNFGLAGTTHVLFSGIAPSGAGDITFSTDIATGSTFGVLAGLQIQEVQQAVVPEPSTFVLTALGLLGFVAIGRRRRMR